MEAHSSVKEMVASSLHPAALVRHGTHGNSVASRPVEDSEPLPDPRLMAQHLAVAIVDVVEGRRDARSVQRWLTTDVYRHLLAMTHARRGQGGSLPALAMTTRTFRVNENTVEFATTVWDQSRARAVAGRLVRMRTRWLIVELESHRSSQSQGRPKRV